MTTCRYKQASPAAHSLGWPAQACEVIALCKTENPRRKSCGEDASQSENGSGATTRQGVQGIGFLSLACDITEFP
jgi:hypothetical protein